jgi:type I restriction enzyme S subunit
MGSDARESCLGEIISEGQAELQTGPFGTMLKAEEYSSEGAPVISVGEIREGYLEIGAKTPRVSSETIERLPRFLLQENDIVFGRKGSTHRNALIKKEEEGYFLGSDGIRLRVNGKSICPRYLSYQLRGGKAVSWLKSNSEGTTMPSLNQDILSRFPITLLPIVEQKVIAHILGTLDDKIEINRNTNETLEAMAKALFQSWFVDFDPVRAKAAGCPTGLPDEISNLFPDSFEESELGEIPRGWRICCVNDLCDWVSSGGTPTRSRKDFWENAEIPWFKTGELNDGPLLDSAEKINELALRSSSCKLWDAGTILFAIYASPTVGRIGVLTECGTSNQAAAGLKARDSVGTPFLRRTLLFSRDELQNIAVGAAQQNINVQILKEHKIVAPGAALMSLYSGMISPLDDQQISLAKSTRELCSLRDTLLPKLISGELRIPEAEKLLEQAGG